VIRAVGLDRGRSEVSIPLQPQGCGPVARPIDLSPPPASVLDKNPILTVEGLSGEDALLPNSQSSDVQHPPASTWRRKTSCCSRTQPTFRLCCFAGRSRQVTYSSNPWYFVTKMNTSNPVWMTKAQLKTRTGEVDWDKLLQMLKKYSSKQTRGGYRVGCNGDPKCPLCLLKNKIKIDTISVIQVNKFQTIKGIELKCKTVFNLDGSSLHVVSVPLGRFRIQRNFRKFENRNF